MILLIWAMLRALRALAPVYSITSSARSRIDGGIARPSAVAVLRFTTISNLVGSCTGRSPGFSPRRMRMFVFEIFGGLDRDGLVIAVRARLAIDGDRKSRCAIW